MKHCIYITLLFASSQLLAQSNTIDSLKRQLELHHFLDEARIDLLNEISYQFWIVDPGEAEEYAFHAFGLADSIKYWPGAGMALRSLGVSNWAMGNYKMGLEYLYESRKIYEGLEDDLNIANVYLNTGLIYADQGSYEDAKKFYERALRTFKELDKPERIINTLNHFGELHLRLKEYEVAEKFLNEALALSVEEDFKYGQSTSHWNRAKVLKARGEYNEAKIVCGKALYIQGQIGDLHGRTNSLLTLGQIFCKTGEYKLAFLHLDKAMETAEKVRSKRLKGDIYKQLMLVAKSQEDYERALDYYQQYAELNYELTNAQLIRNMTRMESKHDLEKQQLLIAKQEQDVKLLEQQAELEAIVKYALILGLILTLSLGYVIYSRQRIAIKKNNELLKKNEEIYEANQALVQAELENATLKEKTLKEDLDFKNKELTSYTLNFMRKNELLTEIKESLQQIKAGKNGEVNKGISSLIRKVDSQNHIDKDWNDFKLFFEQVHTDFFNKLRESYPDITNNELKLCALLKLNMNLKEAANIMGISPDSVKTARYRLRKKLQLETEDNLVDFIMNFDESAV